MKKAIIAILMLVITFSIFVGTGSVAYAEESIDAGTYRARSNIQVYSFVKTDEVSLFTIPATYYFEIYDQDDDYYYIKYNDIDDGLLIKKTADFVALDSNKDKGTLNGFSIELSLVNDSTLFAKSQIKFSETAITINGTTSIMFIGFGSYEGTNCAYVSYNNSKYGYIPITSLKVKGTETMLSNYTIENHPNYRLTINDETDTNKSEVNSNKLIRTILIIGIVVPALIIVLLLFKPSKRNRYDYDRNQREASGTSPYDQPRSRYRDDYYDEPARRRRGNDGYDDDYYDDRRH